MHCGDEEHIIILCGCGTPSVDSARIIIIVTRDRSKTRAINTAGSVLFVCVYVNINIIRITKNICVNGYILWYRCIVSGIVGRYRRAALRWIFTRRIV